MGRPYVKRLLHDLNEVRTELSTEVGKLKPEEFDWSPKPELEMKTCKALLQEIGTMEKICMNWVVNRQMLDWSTAVLWSGDTAASIMKDLEAVRNDTLAYLRDATEEQLQTAQPVPDEWRQYFPEDAIEPEEMIRWVSKHEYYHLGQLISYRWILGDNPYKPAPA
jgi:hypothetical protein